MIPGSGIRRSKDMCILSEIGLFNFIIKASEGS